MDQKPAPEAQRDPIYNDPPPVEIGGRKIVARELKAAVLRRHVRAIFSTVADLRGRHPELGDLGENPGAAVISALMGELDSLAEKATGLIAEMVEGSTGLTQEEQDDLPASAYFDLVGLVLDAQKPGLDAFFRLQGKFGGLAGRALPLPGTDGSARPSPLRDSLAGASA